MLRFSNKDILEDELTDLIPRSQLGQQLESKISRLLQITTKLKQCNNLAPLLSNIQEIVRQDPETLEILRDLMTIKPIDDSEMFGLSKIKLLQAEFQRTQSGYESNLLRLLLSSAAMQYSYEFNGLIDTDGRIWDVNQAPLDVTGSKRSKGAGELFIEAPWFNDLKNCQELVKEQIIKSVAGEFTRFDIDVRSMDRSILTVDSNMTPIKDPDGKVMPATHKTE